MEYKQLKLDLQKGRLLGFAQNDVKFIKDAIILKDIMATSDCLNDIVLAYSESDNFVKIYQGVYTANKLIGVREIILYDDSIEESLIKPKDKGSFYDLDSALKLDRARKFMESKEVRDSELVFFAGVVRSV